MKKIIDTYRLALLLSKSFDEDIYFSRFFSPTLMGKCAKFCFFIDEIKLRRKSGFVLSDNNAVALVGLPPNLYITNKDLSSITSILLVKQGCFFHERWKDIWKNLSEADNETNIAYLSAIACSPKKRNSGHGTALLMKVVTTATKLGLDVVCEVSSDKLLHWYEHRGFKLIEHVKSSHAGDYYILKYSLKKN